MVENESFMGLKLLNLEFNKLLDISTLENTKFDKLEILNLNDNNIQIIINDMIYTPFEISKFV